jgi:signal transduction histidine kinase
MMLGPLVACYTMADLRGWQWGLGGTVVTALTALLATRLAFGASEPAGANASAVWIGATAGAAGTAVGYYRALLVAARAQPAREAQTREEQARRRAAEERLRIARELHDIIGHTLATVSVQARVGIHLFQQRPAQALEALTTIKQISDQGLADVRTILDVLRADSDPDQPRPPRGGLDQLETLLERVRAAGVQPKLTVHGIARPLPAAVDLAAYRIIQEALTNVLRRARARTAWLDLRYEPQQVVISASSTTGRLPAPTRMASSARVGTASAACGSGLWRCLDSSPPVPHPDGGFQARGSAAHLVLS